MPRRLVQIIDPKRRFVKMTKKLVPEKDTPHTIAKFIEPDILANESGGNHDPIIRTPANSTILAYPSDRDI